MTTPIRDLGAYGALRIPEGMGTHALMRKPTLPGRWPMKHPKDAHDAAARIPGPVPVPGHAPVDQSGPVDQPTPMDQTGPVDQPSPAGGTTPAGGSTDDMDKTGAFPDRASTPDDTSTPDGTSTSAEATTPGTCGTGGGSGSESVHLDMGWMAKECDALRCLATACEPLPDLRAGASVNKWPIDLLPFSQTYDALVETMFAASGSGLGNGPATFHSLADAMAQTLQTYRTTEQKNADAADGCADGKH